MRNIGNSLKINLGDRKRPHKEAIAIVQIKGESNFRVLAVKVK